MSIVKPLLIPIIAAVLVALMAAAGYVVVPPCDRNDEGWGCGSASKLAQGWTAEATDVSTSPAGDLQVDLAIINGTGEWSAMEAVSSKPAILKMSGGQVANCTDVLLGTGGHYLAPGFAMRGYITGTASDPQIQLMHVECPGAKAEPGSMLLIDVHYVTGEYNYYDKTAGDSTARLEVDLDKLEQDLTYPMAAPPEDLVLQRGQPITGLNDMTLTLVDATRTEEGLEFLWQAFNPSDYPSALHVGPPPVLGADGILYGLYQDPGSVSAPLTSPGKTTEWSTSVEVPPDSGGLYVMVSVETGTRLFTNYVIDITGQ